MGAARLPTNELVLDLALNNNYFQANLLLIMDNVYEDFLQELLKCKDITSYVSRELKSFTEEELQITNKCE